MRKSISNIIDPYSSNDYVGVQVASMVLNLGELSFGRIVKRAYYQMGVLSKGRIIKRACRHSGVLSNGRIVKRAYLKRASLEHQVLTMMFFFKV